MTSWWYHFPAAFTPEQCAFISAYAQGLPAQAGTVGHGGGTSKVVETIRRSTVRWIPRHDDRLTSVYQQIEDLAHTANNACFGFDISGGFSRLQFTEYDSSDVGHYDWHQDNSFRNNTLSDRKLSMVVQLSPAADYEGGRLELDPKTQCPLDADKFTQQGDVIFFPAFNWHKVHDLTRGNRKSLVTWFTGPHFR